MKLLVATRSAHKLDEIRRIMQGVRQVQVLGLDDAGVAWEEAEEGLEPYDTFEENARSKARWFRDKTGLPTVADDSGLVVDALDGEPGVRSKRFAPDRGLDGQARDDANNRWLVERLAGVPLEDRTARYVCVAVFLDGGEEVRTRGEAPGLIVDEPRGEHGFGYDPHFFDPALGRTFAEIAPELKNARSHRGHAFRKLADRLRQGGA